MSKTILHNCDVCSSEITEMKYVQVDMPVVFKTEQDEGKPVKPYLTKTKMDVCESCMNKIVERFPITAWGAMGFNEYSIIEQNIDVLKELAKDD